MNHSPSFLLNGSADSNDALINGWRYIVYFEADGRCEPAFGQGICCSADTSVIRERV